MLNVIKYLLRIIIIPIALLLLIIIAIGGGYGSKEKPPSVITNLQRPVLFAHRGVVDKYAENSKEAIREAIDKGFPAVEIDIQFSADSTFFLYHNNEIKLSDGSIITADKIRISDKPTSIYYYKPDTLIYNIPTLQEIINKYKFKLIFYFDMKRQGHSSIFDLAHDISKFIEKNNLYNTALIASAHFFFITYLEFTNPRINTVLEGIDTKNPWLYNLIPRKFKPDMIASRQATINDEFIQWLKNNDMLSRYIVYHGNESNFRSTMDKGIEMFIIDYDTYLDNYLHPDTIISTLQ